MSRDITPEQFHEYQQQWTQPVADGDAEGQRRKQNAAYWVAYCYYFGTGGVDVDSDEAQQILERVVQEQDGVGGDNNNDNSGNHRCFLANMLDDAWLVNRDQARSSQLYREAVPRLEMEVQDGGNDENYQEAAYHLGHSLFYGYGVEKDCRQGIHWLKSAAELGHEAAQSSIYHDCFQDIEEPFISEIFSWLQQIADQNNNVWAQFFLGDWYKNGWCGVKKDLVKAVEWYNKAIAQGDEDATRRRQYLLDHLSPEDRNKILGCVACNQKIEKARSLIQQSFVGGAPLSLWPHALASFQNQVHPPWEAPSPTFLSMKDAIMLQLRKQSKQQERKNQKRDLQSGNKNPGPSKRSG